MLWGLDKALVLSHATARVHRAEHFATCGACLEAPEVERGNRYSVLRMTAKGHVRTSRLPSIPMGMRAISNLQYLAQMFDAGT